MSKSLLLTQLGVICLALCLVGLDFASASRIKRGFRTGTASRVAHGYGKRGDTSLSDSKLLDLSRSLRQHHVAEEDEVLPKINLVDLIGSAQTADELEGYLSTVDEFAQLLSSSPALTRAITAKFVDADGDGVITTSELFRSTRRK